VGHNFEALLGAENRGPHRGQNEELSTGKVNAGTKEGAFHGKISWRRPTAKHGEQSTPLSHQRAQKMLTRTERGNRSKEMTRTPQGEEQPAEGGANSSPRERRAHGTEGGKRNKLEATTEPGVTRTSRSTQSKQGQQ